MANVEVVAAHRGANAYVSYTVPPKGGKPARNRIYSFWLERIEQGHEINGQTYQSQTFMHFYARNFISGRIAITGRVKDQDNYDTLAEFIRNHQMLMVGTSGGANVGSKTLLPLLKFGIPSENLYYQGWVESFPGGAKRFNPAPQFTMQFTVAADKHSTNELIIPSYLKRATFTGAFLDGPVYKPTKVDKVDIQDSASAVVNEAIDIAGSIKDAIGNLFP